MNVELSSNAQAILLLTAPLIVGQKRTSVNPLTAGEYRNFARRLRDLQRQPADLLEPDARKELKEWGFGPETDRLLHLLGRGFLLTQAMERWQSRAIWVLSRADPGYPRRLKQRLGEDAPPVLYGCGDPSILGTGGLAVAGSRNLNDSLIGYTKSVGRLSAESQQTLVSGGAKGTDQAAMQGALEVGGRVVGVLADSLEKAVMRRDYRDALVGGWLALTCPYDPAARFLVGHAMQRNKLIYALSDAALVVNSDYWKGGTWAGAVEQLDKLRFVPVYVRSHGRREKGLDALRDRGAIPWPNPKTPAALGACLKARARLKSPEARDGTNSDRERQGLPLLWDEPHDRKSPVSRLGEPADTSGSTPAEELFATVKTLLASMDGPRTEASVAQHLDISRPQARNWLKRFVETELRALFRRTNETRTAAEVRGDSAGFRISDSQFPESVGRRRINREDSPLTARSISVRRLDWFLSRSG